MRQTVVDTPHVLIVESDQEAREWCCELLTHDGYNVTAVADGPSAIKQLVRHHFDLMIAEYALPGMSGGKLVHAVRQWKKKVPTVLMSDHPNVSQLATHYHAHGYFHKGDPPAMLAACVTALLPTTVG